MSDRTLHDVRHAGVRDTPRKYIYSVDDEYNGVVIRGECYDRQFMFGKGAGSLPTASSILSDIMARLNNYRYEYKKQNYIDSPDYTTDMHAESLCPHTRRPTCRRSSTSRPHPPSSIAGEDEQLRDRRHPPFGDLLAKREVLRGKGRFHGRFPELLPRAGSLEPKDRPPSNERLPNFRFRRR